MEKHKQGRKIKPFELHPVDRHVAPAPRPYIITEKDVPKGQKALVFLPHSDDGALIGGTLHFMNKKEGGKNKNDMKIIVVSPGHEGMEGNEPAHVKKKKRWGEAVKWASKLGFERNQIVNFHADKTYTGRKNIHPEDQKRMQQYIEKEQPTMVFVPHIADTYQHINFNTRRMVLNSVNRWLRESYKKGEKKHILLVEYPTNHIPILPPSDKNLDIAFTDRKLAEVKHEANKVHDSQKNRMGDITPQMIEAMNALTMGDDIQKSYRVGRRLSRHLSGIAFDGRHSRGEHFGLTKLRVLKQNDVPIIKEDRIKFPLVGMDKRKWEGK